ncbi:hypothetical protein NESM_000620600 [Novymonas esmeraldas]|uniref:Orc1-like AAA ATPase domain-containing protein n=1 Tax=Novymonas esmeraldas TaxID=1808958 RepID=A0AAW0ERL9_9TRYP
MPPRREVPRAGPTTRSAKVRATTAVAAGGSARPQTTSSAEATRQRSGAPSSAGGGAVAAAPTGRKRGRQPPCAAPPSPGAASAREKTGAAPLRPTSTATVACTEAPPLLRRATDVLEDGGAAGALSLLQRHLPPPTATAPTDAEQSGDDTAAMAAFLADAQSHLSRHVCARLARLTTATSHGFLNVAALGEAALASPPPSSPAAAEQLLDRQEDAYRTLRATIAASCALGHRSCQVLWGPRGSGKHRLLRLLAHEVRQTPNTVVLELHGRLLADDEAALGVIAQQLLLFLKSPQSAQLRATHYLLRTGTFGFGQLFHFDRHMQRDDSDSHGDGGDDDVTAGGDGAAAAASVAGALPRGAGRGRARPGNRTGVGRGGTGAAAHVVDGDDADDVVAESGSEVLVTSTMTYLTGGAASALPHLQRALLLLKGQGASIVVCIRDIDVFCIRCDQLLYVLSGLMHDGDGGGDGNGGSGSGRGSGSGGGGGLSLVLASAAPDIRQLEKRLSSRLTCETRYVPLLPWSPRVLLAATLHTTAQDGFGQVRLMELTRARGALVAALRSEATQLRLGAESRGRRRGKDQEHERLTASMADLEARLHACDATLRKVHALRRHLLGSADLDASSVATVTAAAPPLGFVESSGWRSPPPPTTTAAGAAAPLPTAARGWSVHSLRSHPSLTMEVQCVMCEELLRQLRGATPLACGPGRASASLSQLATELSAELELQCSTGATALTVLTSLLCRAASGAVDLLGDGGRRVLLQWLRARLQSEPVALSAAASASATSPAAAPDAIVDQWRAATLTTTPVVASTVYARRCTALPPLSLLPPLLHDLLGDGQLVGMGYGSREVLLLLFYMHLHHTSGLRQRTVADLLEDVSSSLGTKAAAALDRSAFRYAVRLLCRWRLLRVVEAHAQLLEICSSGARLRDFLLEVLSTRPEWCEEELGLDARERMRLRNLV